MPDRSRTILAVLAALLALHVWGNCRESAGASKQRLRDSTTVVDAHRDSTDRRVAALAAESSELGGKLRRFARNDSVARVEIARLRGNLISAPALVRDSPDTLLAQDTGVSQGFAYDTVPREVLITQLAIKDSIIDAQDSVIASQDDQLTIWRALANERGELLTQALGERDSYRRIAIAWQQKAEPGVLTKAVRAIPYIAAGFVLAKLIP